MFLAITAFVLAIVVPIAVGVVLLTYVSNRLATVQFQVSAMCSATRDTLATSLTTLTDRVSRCENGIEKTSAAHVAAELAALAGDVERLASSQRKQFGKVWAELHHDGTLERNTAKQQTVETPEEVRARLREQHGLPKVGGNGAGRVEE